MPLLRALGGALLTGAAGRLLLGLPSAPVPQTGAYAARGYVAAGYLPEASGYVRAGYVRLLYLKEWHDA